LNRRVGVAFRNAVLRWVAALLALYVVVAVIKVTTNLGD